MTIAEKLHSSRTHRAGFDPCCPQCLRTKGIDGIIDHLMLCAAQNTRDARDGRTEYGGESLAVAREQRRMIGVLKLYRKAKQRKQK